MNLILGTKAKFAVEDVQRVWDDPEPYVNEHEARNAVEVAARELKAVAGGYRTGMCWSGGKDSLALEVVVRAAGFPTRGVCGVAAALEVPEALAWYRDHIPEGVEEYDRRDYDLAWLRKHPQYLFPDQGGADAQVFTLGVTRWSQHQYIKDAKPEVLLLGRRRADGNWFPNTAYGAHVSKDVAWYSPIRSWPHEMVLAVLRYNDVEIPPTYSWPAGWKTGTGPWPGWRLGVEAGRRYLEEVSPEAYARALNAGVL